MWRHPSGILVPRGTVVATEQTDPDDFLQAQSDWQDSSDRRGVQAHTQKARKVKRSAADTKALDALCDWLAERGLDIIGTVTFTDEYAKRHGIYNLGRGLDDVEQGLKDITLKGGSIHGFRGAYALGGEWHPSGRQVPHVHLALSSNGAVDINEVCSDLFAYFSRTRGRSRFEQMRDVTKGSLYALKDTLKASATDPSCMRLRSKRRHPSYRHTKRVAR